MTTVETPIKNALGDSIRRADFDKDRVVYSDALLKKIRAVAKSKSGKVRRLITKEERAELESIHWLSTSRYFMYRGVQICLSVRASGDLVLYAI